MLRVEQTYPNGVPQTAVSGWSPKGLAWHWTAGGTGRAGWDGSVRHLINTRYTVNASYHAGFWHEHATETTVVQWIVPSTKAAHSIAPSKVFELNPNKSRALQEARFAEVRRILLRDNDPNADCIALSYAGMPADLQRDLGCPVFRADVQELARQIIDHPAVIDRPHFGHGWIQPISRYEMDVATDFIGLLYGETDVPIFTRPVREKWRVPSGTEFYTGGPEAGERKLFTANVELWSNGETTDGAWRRFEYGNEELWLKRADITPISGTRNPATGYGEPKLTTTVQGVKPESYAALQQQGVTALKNIGIRANADAEALAAKKP